MSCDATLISHRYLEHFTFQPLILQVGDVTARGITNWVVCVQACCSMTDIGLKHCVCTKGVTGGTPRETGGCCACTCTTLHYCEDAKKFKDAFEECQEKLASTAGGGDAELAAKMEKLEVEGEEDAGEEEKARSLSTV